MKNYEVKLTKLKSKLRKKEEIDINAKTSVDYNGLIVITSSGKEEGFNFRRIEKMALKACNGNKHMVKQLLDATRIKLYNKIKTKEIQGQMIKTAESFISRLTPDWEFVAAKLFLETLYDDTYNIGGYPHLSEFIKKGVNHRLINSEAVRSFSDEEINILNNAIQQNRDNLFTYKALKTFSQKYHLKTKSGRPIELPQITYMRVAMGIHFNKKGEKRINDIINEYHTTSTFERTHSTPTMLNSLTNNNQLASCVLTKTDDDTNSIMSTNANLATYSKWKGGTSLDVDLIRSTKSYIEGNGGKSSGPVPFIKITEAIMKAFNQGGTRPGACAIYFSYFNYNFEELIVLKNNGGIEETRARGLKYGVKLNNLFIRRWIKDEEITLFNPSDTPELFKTWGKEWEEHYERYEKTSGILKKRLRARDMWSDMAMKERSETGNIYMFHLDNVNKQNLLGKDYMVTQSNLCTEIFEYTEPTTLIEEKLMFEEDGSAIIYKKYNAGQIALCNLSSFNLMIYDGNKSDKDIDNIIRLGLISMDEIIDRQYYPVKEGQYSNKMWRYAGFGMSNLAQLLAHEGIVFDTQEALEYTHELFDDISYKILYNSMLMAKEKGAFPNFHKTDWAKGILPIHKANKKALALTEYQPDMEKWNALAKDIMRYGLRFGLHMAIAPTATSGTSINATPSTEPIFDFEYKEEADGTLLTLAPDVARLGKYYKPAFQCNQIKLIENAAIRQCYLDQGQSINMYFNPPFSLEEQANIHFYAFALGIKSLYYFNTKKEEVEGDCPSCT